MDVLNKVCKLSILAIVIAVAEWPQHHKFVQQNECSASTPNAVKQKLWRNRGKKLKTDFFDIWRGKGSNTHEFEYSADVIKLKYETLE